MNNRTAPRRPDINRLSSDTAYLREYLDNLAETVETIESNVYSLLVTRSETPAAPVANILWNGEVGHSVNSWHDAAYVTTDKAKEAAFWFTHNKPFAPQVFTAVSVADTIPLPAHGITLGAALDFLTTGTLPTGLALATTYYAIPVDDDNIKVASSLANAEAGTPVSITTGTGTGTHTAQQKLDLTDARSFSANNTLKTSGYGALSAHSTYNARYSRWNASNGWAELTGTMSVDTPLPSNHIDASTPLARVSIGRAAKRNAYIEIPNDARLGVGIYDDTSGQRDFLKGDLGLTAVVNGTPASTVERRYKIHVTTDRGFSLLSQEVTVLNAPADGFFGATANVSLAWRATAGFLQVDIYEYIPSLSQYRLLFQVSAGNSYIHLGNYLSLEAGYPAADGALRQAVYFTRNGELTDLATDGGIWDTINYPIEIPDNYNKNLTTGRQWVRIWMTKAANLFVSGITTDGTNVIDASDDCFGAEYNSFWDAGTLAAEIYDEFDTLIAATTVAGHEASENLLRLADNIPAGTNRKIRIVGAGFHGVLLDKIHLGFQQNTSYAPNALDSRVLQPVAAPSSSSQGGSGGGSGGGIDNCIGGLMPVKLANGSWKPARLCKPGERWASDRLQPNLLCKLRPGIDYVRFVLAENGVWVLCTDSERFVVDESDCDGTPLWRLRVGDFVITEKNGLVERSKIIVISPHLEKQEVFTPTLSNSKIFIAGQIKEKFLRRILRKITGKPAPRGGFYLHNNKNPDILV